ncbi:SGNH/GDSL hydrolase family protein [Chryseobacterium sp. NFX27]|uniref:SGNH/GDSL hydrolase family protein n=1 Tax=Chryseobacterium sp. NFX27 TaxID=2819618 RepID=UPI003CE6E3C3
MTKQEILDQIAESITSNGLQQINGVILNTILTAIAEIIPEDSMLTSSFGGIVKATDTIITTPGVSRWFIAKGGVYTNYGGFTLLDKNFNILSFDGANWDKVEIELPNFQISPTFDPTTKTVAQGGRQIAEWIGAVDTVTPLVIGMTGVGGSDAAMGGTGAEGNLITNSNCKATKTLKVKNVVTNLSVAGTFKVAITDKNNVIIYTSPIYTAGIGSQTTVLPDIVLQKDETIWLMALDASTAKIRWNGGSAVTTNRFLQRPATTGAIVQGPVSSYYSIFFNTEFTENTGILKGYIPRSEAEGFTDVDPLEAFGSAAYTNVVGNQTTTAYYILKIPFTVDKVIKELNFSGNGGNMTFVIGSLDQANKFIEERSFVVSTVTGVNTIAVDQLLKAGQYLGVKTPGNMPNIHTTLQNNYTWGIEGNHTNPLIPLTAWSLGLAFKAKTRVLNTNALVRQTAINDLQAQINNFQPSKVWQSADGTNWKVGVSNTGQFIAQAVGRYTKILHFGNSILRHAIMSYWWGDWGMAAKTRNDDYAHRFLAKIKVANPTAQSWEQNIAAWEQNPSGYNKAQLDTLLTAQAYDLIVVRLGENATSIPVATYKTEFRNLITYIQSKVPTARIIIGGMFWSNAGLEGAMQQIAIEKNLTYVDMSGLDIAANKSFIGDTVQGDDGQTHTVDNAGVANHPNNAGMEAIATRLFTASQS